ncbi:hypothetical protein YC2023_061389 [Brassica napus]
MDDVPLVEGDSTRNLRISSKLSEGLRRRLVDFLRSNSDCFAWSHLDMPEIDPQIIMHRLQVDPSHHPTRQKRRKFALERYIIINEEVKNLLEVGFIREVQYPEWLDNVVVVKKKNRKWRVCIDFTDLNKSCPKDPFPLPHIDKLVDATAVHRLMSFMDKFRKYNMKLNPDKFSFGVSSGKFLGYIVTHRGIKANPEQIRAIHSIPSPRSVKEDQKLTVRMAALSRFISRLSDKSQTFLETLKKPKDLKWTEECESALLEFKAYLTTPPLLSKPLLGEVLLLYLTLSEHAVSAVLVQEEGTKQLPIYYVSKALLDAETRYSHLEKLALALLVATRKLRPYFQAHPVVVVTSFPIKLVLHKPEVSGRLVEWAVELGEYNIISRPATAIKSQALADFVAEFSPALLPALEQGVRLHSGKRKKENGSYMWMAPVTFKGQE